jgi:hypothetical protein
MNENGKEKMKLLTEFLNITIQVFNCMKNKCKIINEKINKNPLYKEYTIKLLNAKKDEELIEVIDYIMNIAEYPEYTECQYKKCNKNIKKFIIILLKLYNFYKNKENKIFPVFIEEALIKLETEKSKKKQQFNQYERELNILLAYISRLT